jgi:hypothetical protein
VGGKRTLQPAGKINFCNPTTPVNNQNEAAVVGFMGDRRRYTIEYRNARFMVVPVICVCCRGVEKALKSHSPYIAPHAPLMLPQWSINK